MRALAYFGTKDIHFTDKLPEPCIEKPDDVLIEIEWCGICGTDLHELLDGPNFFPEDGKVHEISGHGLPQAMGHEMSGKVVEIGSAVTKLKLGDHVVVEPTGTCQDRARYNTVGATCKACEKGLHNICLHLGLSGCGVQSGGFAEKVVMSEKHCFRVPAWIPLDVAALIQPLAVCWHAVKVGRVKAGDSALIIGGGPIGLGMIMALQSFGCSKIVLSEPAKIRRELAEKMGAVVVNPLDDGSAADSIARLRKMAPEGEGFDYTFDCSGIEVTFEAAIHCLTFRGTAVNVAVWGHRSVEFFPSAGTLQERRYTGSMCYTMEDFEDVVKSFTEGKTDIATAAHMITGRVSLENGLEDAFMRLINDKEDTIKVLLTPKKELLN
ncbi:unnamed protein product [Kluyveromyces dobzhanskii CBS 2104]|uniref:WGS project CCBQ000000000 data, contig 00272 n=1 Tax=Kluyveromyces dobzhanskii CBS 2104 TaxID=1427455 RepID=A0A0A8LAQ5_9SACH|nr:unnamed protein product [Kluyveromyces dobzhanskii CBS 2104]